MKSRPPADRILVKPDEPVKKEGELYLPEEKSPQGIVVAIGSGRIGANNERIPVEPQVGDKVLYGKFSGIEITLDEIDYLIMREGEVLLIL